MIEVKLWGRLGNQMFQYATMRTIAEAKGYSFCVEGRKWLGHELFDLDLGQPGGVVLTHQYKETIYQYDPRIWDIQDGTYIVGFFQSEKYFNNDKAREWFKLMPDNAAELILKQYPVDEYCYINLRGTDVKELGVQKLPLAYYQEAIEHMLNIKPNLKFIVITDDAPYGHEYFPYYPIMSNSVKTDFTLLNRAKYVILANSSFAWWAAWLNLDNYVIAPQGWLDVSKDRSVKKEFSPKDIKVDRFIWI